MSTSSSTSYPEFKFKVLVVEDNPTNQKVTLWHLGKLGIQADLANNGVEAIQMLEDKNYDIVFMDCQMPEMDGYDATRMIRQKEKKLSDSFAKRPPLKIIALTAHALEPEREKCISCGMDDYMTKPSKMEDFIVMLQKIQSDITIHKASSAGETLSPSELLDEEQLSCILGITGEEIPDDLLDIYKMFIEESQKKIDSIRKKVETHQLAGLDRDAHQLRGSVANFGFRALAQLLHRIEFHLAEISPEEFQALLTKMEDLFRRCQELVKSKYSQV